MIFTPKEILAQISLPSNFIVAEFGSGSGNFSLELAKILTDGKLYAIEVQKNMVDTLNKQFEKNDFKNCVAVWGDLEKNGGTRLRDQSVDFVLIANILFQIEDKVSFIKEAKRIIKPGAKIAIIDWSDSFNNLGPSKEAVFSKETALSFAQENDLHFLSEIDTGKYHYGLIFSN